jgi:hypothetical protein
MLGMGLAFLTDAAKQEQQTAVAAPGLKLGFSAVSKNISDSVTVPPGTPLRCCWPPVTRLRRG